MSTPQNGTFRIAEHPDMQVEVILASKPARSADHNPIFTVRLRYPRPLHGEIMTHRMFSRNARSSRAVPVKTMLNEVRINPYVPWHWGKNQSGMQADEECNEPVNGPASSMAMTREFAWLKARDFAAETAEAFMEAGYHKQNPNRLLEPFSWIDTLITSTDWDNFLWLREHKDAEPHLQDLAELIHFALNSAHIQALEEGQWHQPYITHADWDEADRRGLIFDEANEFINTISAARCARISYTPFDGDASYEKEISRYNQLVTSDRVHASPLEHQAKADEKYVTESGDREWRSPQWHGNLTGYIQARKLVPNEVYSSM